MANSRQLAQNAEMPLPRQYWGRHYLVVTNMLPQLAVENSLQPALLLGIILV